MYACGGSFIHPYMFSFFDGGGQEVLFSVPMKAIFVPLMKQV